MRLIKILIIDCYQQAKRLEFINFAMKPASQLYYEVLQRNKPNYLTIETDVLNIIEEELPKDLSKYDGIAWTGSSLSVISPIDKINLLGEQSFEQGIPSFGSCYGMQLAASLVGASVIVNPLGREFGVGDT